MTQLWARLFISFVFIGLGSYGGGLVAIPLIQHELVVNQRWMSFEEMSTIIAIAQMTPGPIAINAATFTGFRLSGIMGAAVATLAVIFPSMLLYALALPFVEKFKNNSLKKAFHGLQAGVLSLILFAVWSYGSTAIKGWIDLLIAGAAFLFLVSTEGKVHPVLVILMSGAIGAVIF